MASHVLDYELGHLGRHAIPNSHSQFDVFEIFIGLYSYLDIPHDCNRMPNHVTNYMQYHTYLSGAFAICASPFSRKSVVSCCL